MNAHARTMSVRISLLALAAIVAVASVGPVRGASTPQTINYQGRLTDNSPNQVPVDGTVPMRFAIYDALTGGAQLWAEPASGTVAVEVHEGIFNVILGANGVPLPASVFGNGTTRYLSITVAGEDLSPRQVLGSVPYAFQAETAVDAGGLGGSPAASWQLRVNDPCPGGSAINAIHADGTVSCVIGPAGATGPSGPAGPTGPTGATGPPGTTGQSATIAYGTAALTVSTTTFILVPGLSQTVNVPPGSALLVSTDGGLATTSTSSSGNSVVNVAIFIDGVVANDAGYRRIVAANAGGILGIIANWSFSIVQVLPAGAHTIQVQAGGQSGAIATVSGDSTSAIQGQLTVVILKQ